MLLEIAWKNVWRNKKRSAIILAAAALGLCGGLFATGIMVGMYDSMVNTAIDRNLGHLQIHTAAFKRDRLISQAIPHAAEIIAQLQKMPEVRGVTGRTIVEGMASSPASATGIVIAGIQPAAERQVCTIDQSVKAGSYFEGAAHNPILIGEKLAEKLKIKLKSKMVLSFSGPEGSIVYGAFRVSGIFHTEASTFDGSTVFVQQADLARVMGAAPLVHEIAVRLQAAQDLPALVDKLKAEYGSLAIESWQELAPELKLTVESTDLSMMIFLGVILFALLFGITNTMLMAVVDRIRELGVLLAIGMKRTSIFGMIIVETIFLALAGGLAGIAGGAALIAYFGDHGIDLAVVAEGLSAYGISSVVYPVVPTPVYFTLAAMVVITAVIAAVYPGFKAVQLSPATAIRTYT